MLASPSSSSFLSSSSSGSRPLLPPAAAAPLPPAAAPLQLCEDRLGGNMSHTEDSSAALNHRI